jgi:hypothetical protein
VTVGIDAAAFRAFERAGWESKDKATNYAAAWGPITSRAVDCLLNAASVQPDDRVLDLAGPEGSDARKRRYTGPRAATTSMSPRRSSTSEPTSKRLLDQLRTDRHWTTRSTMAAGEWHACSSRRSARVQKLWQVASLGILARLEELLEGATTDEINNAFWHACARGQRRAAELLFTRGADVNWIPEYATGTPWIGRPAALSSRC